ncbi:hypothetical protein ABZ863_23375 [Saccharomonospora sp. NPDC046836]|uniref:hypothetical protein n=1 Tax=Saccharomonospora sp. NPDC046836 TaxID=3156921 RepID=UPI0033C14A12
MTTEQLADAIATEVSTHPSVVRLDGGALGTLATYLPRRKIVGVRVTEPDEPIDIGVVLRLGRRLPEVTGELRERVRAIAGNVPVNVTVTDVVPASTVDTVDAVDAKPGAPR